MIYSNSITKTVERSIESYRGLLKGLTNIGKSTIILTFSDQIDPSQVETAINSAKNTWKFSKWEYSHNDKNRDIKVTCTKLRF